MLRAWILAVVALTVASCAVPARHGDFTMSRKGGQTKCENSGNCEVAVAVYCPPNVAQKCLVTVDLSLVEIDPKDSNNNNVKWRLDNQGSWRFPAEGAIGIDANFECNASEGQFVRNCKAKSTTPPGIYKYTIKVEWRYSSNVRYADPLDPWVVTN